MLDTPYHQVVVKAAQAAASLAVSALVAKAQAQHSKVLVQLKLIQANNKVAAKAKAKAIRSTQVNKVVAKAKAIRSIQVNKVVAKAKAKETHLIQVNNKVIQAKAAIHSIQANNKEIQANNKVANNKQSRLHPYPYH